MKKIPTDAELEAEVDYFVKHIDEISARQQRERDAYFADPANAERIAQVEQRMAIAEQLYNARKNAGLTQAQVAAKMSVSRSVVARLERVRGNISCATLLKYARACGCSLNITLI